MVRTTGLFESHLTVTSVDVSIGFYRDRLGLEMAHRVDERKAAFFWVGDRRRSMIGLWETGDAPNVMRLHVAFACALPDVLSAPDRLRAAGITPRGSHGELVNEPVVIGWMPAASVYCNDPDGHLLEYLAMLPGAPSPEVGIVPYSDWARR